MQSPAQIARVKASIVSLTAILAKLDADFLNLADVTVERYQLDDGQGTQSARRHDLDVMINSRAKLEGQLTDLEARLHGGTVQVVPGW